MTGIFYALEILYPVRAKRGELRGPKGCLRKCIAGREKSLPAAKAEVERYMAAMTYGAPTEARYYDAADWDADCLTAQPILRVKL